MVTISAALEEKLTTPREVFDCQMGSIVINGMRIHDSRPHGLLPVSEILAESSDVGSIKIGMRLGDDRFYKYIRGFGFGQQTGIELPGETRGLSKPPNRWSRVSFAAISMGQEIGITPLQLVGLDFDHGERWSMGGAHESWPRPMPRRARRRPLRFIPPSNDA